MRPIASDSSIPSKIFREIRMRVAFIVIGLIALAGCASQDGVVAGGTAPVVVASRSEDLNPQTKLHCHKESPAGSNMIRTVCEADPTASDRNVLQNKLLDVGSQNRAEHRGIGG
jgi:uncharacterized protein with LGFP repeats